MNDPNPSATGGSDRLRILLVEDNLAASRGLARLLEAQGYEVSVVSDGASALAALRHGPPPDFLLTDLQLPDFDGLEVARLAHQLDPPPRVALITGWDIDGVQRGAERWGIEWVFPKPLDVQDLIARLRQPARLERDTRQSG